jgi:spore maturation protein CgeB
VRFVIFGLTVSSSWGNGHATLWRGLVRALGAGGHHVDFFERDVPYYAKHRDLGELDGGALHLYASLADSLSEARDALAAADVAMVTSYCPDGPAASDLVLASRAPCKAFYDLDTPVTLSRLASGDRPEYLPREGLGDFDLVLSFTGGTALDGLKSELGARRVAPLYGSVDPEVHRPVRARDAYRADLSYLGTRAADRDHAVRALFLDAARALPDRRFLLGGSLYPASTDFPANVARIEHVPPPEHAAFYGSARLSLNVTRGVMKRAGFCPSGRLFEAAACGAPIVTDAWEGIDRFFEEDREILVAASTADVLAALARTDEELWRIGRAARERALGEHTAAHRAAELLAAVEAARGG